MTRATATLAACCVASQLALQSLGLPAIAAPAVNGKILFESDRDGNFEIYTMKPDGSEQTNLTNHPGADQRAAWSPDGTRTAFSSNRDDPAFEIYEVALNCG